MKKRFLAFLFVVLLVLSGTATAFADGPDGEKSIDRSKAIQELSELNGGELIYSNSNGQIFLSGDLSGNLAGSKQAGADQAGQFLERYKPLFEIGRVTDELKNKGTSRDDTGDTFVTYAQTIKGIEVEGCRLVVHFDETGGITSVSGKMLEDREITTLGDGLITEQQAIDAAKGQFEFTSLDSEPTAEKLIVTANKKNYVAYKVNIAFKDPEFVNSDVYVEAYSGQVIKTESNIRYDGPAAGTGVDVQGVTRSLNLVLENAKYLMHDEQRAGMGGIWTCDSGHKTEIDIPPVSNTTNVFNTENYKASVSAHFFAGKVVDFYSALFHRNSLDGNGMAVKSYTHFGVDYDNAFWSGAEMVYGDGDGVDFTYLSGDLDIVGHEMTHGVIEHTADLYYHHQPGALNESFADVFGVMIETYVKYGVASGGSWQFNAADWVIGDAIVTPAIPGDALRSLADPELYHQPDHMSEYGYYADTEAGDYGGVHINSGIPNRAAFLVAQNIGMEKTARIYYRALSYYVNMYANFQMARFCLNQAAKDLYGESSAEAAAIDSAFAAVGVVEIAVDDPYEPNNTWQTATVLRPGEAYQSYLSSSSDDDFYKINIAVPGTVEIDLTNLPADYDMELYGPSGYRVDDSKSDGTASESIDYAATATGTYYLWVYPYDGGSTTQQYSLTATYQVTAATGMSLNLHELSLKAGQSSALSAVFQPANATYNGVRWATDHTDVVTVDDWGKLFAVKAGTATITVTADDGGYTDSCTVTVTPITVSFDSQSGSAVSPKTAAYNARITAPAAPTRPGFAFAGWYRQAACTTAWNFAADRVTADIMLYAKWAIPALAAPASPRAASSSYTSITVAWNAVPYASGYEVWRALSSGGTYAKVGATAATSFTNTALSTGTAYYYKVRAYRTGSPTVYSGFSSAVSVIPAPAAPAAVKAAPASYNSIQLTWAAVAGATKYELYRATSANGSYKLLTTTAALSYTNKSVNTGTAYYYRLRAYRLVSGKKVYGPWSAVASAKTVLTAPAAPKAAALTYNSIKLTWGKVAGASKYEIYRATSLTGSYKLLAATSSASYTNKSVDTGTTYYYKVAAYRLVSGKKVYGPYSATVSAKTALTASPASPKAVPLSYSSVKLFWRKVTGASGYEVSRATSANGIYSPVASAPSTTCTDTAADTGTTYYYKIRAYRLVSGNRVYGPYSAIVSAKTVLPAPTSVKAARASASSITVSWRPVAGATMVEVWQATSASGPYTLLTTAASATYTNTGLVAGKYCYYKVRAYRLVGGTKVTSAYSAVVKARP